MYRYILLIPVMLLLLLAEDGPSTPSADATLQYHKAAAAYLRAESELARARATLAVFTDAKMQQLIAQVETAQKSLCPADMDLKWIAQDEPRCFTRPKPPIPPPVKTSK